MIPNSVKEIYPYSFEGCTGLESVTISSEVTGIYIEAFAGCTNIQSITYLADDPFKTYKPIFSDETFSKAVLYYLEAAEDKINDTAPWNLFEKRIAISQ